LEANDHCDHALWTERKQKSHHTCARCAMEETINRIA
jgi:hypothetical protein